MSQHSDISPGKWGTVGHEDRGQNGSPGRVPRSAHRPASPAGGFCIPLYIPYILTGEWKFGKGLCKLWLVTDYLVCTASVFNIVLISYDRFISVTRAVRKGEA